MNTSPDQFDLVSIGKACGELGAPADRIRLAADQLGVKIAARLDGREYYSAADVVRIARVLTNMSAATHEAYRRYENLR